MTARVCLDLTPMATRSRYRGIGRYVDGLARAMAALPAPPEFTLTALILRGRLPEVVPLSEGLGWLDDLPPVRFDHYFTYYLWKHAVLAGALRRGRADLYHAPDPKGLPRFGRPRTLSTCHDLIPYMLGPPYLHPLWPRPAQRLVEQYRYRLPDHVIAISDWTRQDLQQATGLPDARITVIPHGIDRVRFTPEPEATDEDRVHRLVGAAPFFLYVGAFDPRKQVDLLIDALSEAAPLIDETLVICGAPPPRLRPRLQARIEAAQLASRVLLLDFVNEDDLAALYRRATAHVLLSTYEGFGFTLFEAMACGCPVLALARTCVPELCGDAALLLRDNTREEAAQALRRLAQDADLRWRLRRLGLERAARFTWPRCAQATLEVYAMLVRKAGRTPIGR